ncbi:MAG TPA: DUF1800 domain-containing protein [Pseudonocardia sp.]
MTPIGERDAVRRLLQRLGLGARRGELDAAAAAGFDATLDSLTTPGPDQGAAATPVPTLSPVDRKAQDPASAQTAQAERAQLVMWWLDRMAAADRPFPERVTWFWHGHFATSIQKVRFASLMAVQNATQRRLGTGDFRALAQAMVVDPAMLVWLDGGGNRVGKPNENLAREFMELFTLGVDHYTETDVRSAARALTGWAVNVPTATTSLVPRRHDPGPETVLGRSVTDAPSLVDQLVSLPVSPQFIAGRVWTRFVSDTPPDQATLAALVNAYGSGHDITALLRAAARAPAFRDSASVLVREPVLWLVSALRALNLPASKVTPAALAGGLTGLGQVPFAPPNVGGWPAGTPWLTTASALARLNVARSLVAVGDFSPVADATAAERVDATAALLGLPGFTERTTAALAPLARMPSQLVAAALASPESCVSA